jgi:hypothetical protein
MPNSRRLATCPDTSALVGDFDDEALAVDLAANADLPAVLAIVGMNNRIGDGLGHGEGDGLRHLRRGACHRCELSVARRRN